MEPPKPTDPRGDAPRLARGVVVERLPDARFRARLDDGRELMCVLPRVCALPSKVFSLLPAVGEVVSVEPSPYDPTRGRLVFPPRRTKHIDRGLLRLIRDFQAAVLRAVEALRAVGVEPPATRRAWMLSRPPQLRARRHGLYSFRKHGAGCEVRGPGLRVDFDFGDDGELDGFDAWRLGEFAAGRLARYGFTRRRAIERAFEDALVAGHFRRRGSAWYLALPAANHAVTAARGRRPAHRGSSPGDPASARRTPTAPAPPRGGR